MSWFASVLITWHAHRGTRFRPRTSSVFYQADWLQSVNTGGCLAPQQVGCVTVTRILIKGSTCCGKAWPRPIAPHADVTNAYNALYGIASILLLLFLLYDIIREIVAARKGRAAFLFLSPAGGVKWKGGGRLQPFALLPRGGIVLRWIFFSKALGAG